MNSAVRTYSRRACVGLAAIFIIIVLASAARAADPVFPPGSRVGLVPPPGMVPSHTFEGFEDPEKNAAVIITTLPAAAYDQMEKAAATDALKKQGINIDKREPIRLNAGKGFLVTALQTAESKARYHKWILVAALADVTALVTVQVPEDDTAYPDKVVRAALATLAVRAAVPDAERLSLLPFSVGDLAGFHVDGVLPGRALMLVDPPADANNAAPADAKDGAGTAKDAAKDAKDNPGVRTLNARFLIAAAPGGPTEQGNRDEFARLTFEGIQGIKNVHVTMAEPLRIGGQSGYETVADAKDTQTDSDIRVVQWLRFGNGGYMQMIGIVRADVWPDVFKRLRTVRDSIEPK